MVHALISAASLFVLGIHEGSKMNSFYIVCTRVCVRMRVTLVKEVTRASGGAPDSKVGYN